MGLTIEDRGYNGYYGAPLWGDVALDFRSADQSRCLGSRASTCALTKMACRWLAAWVDGFVITTTVGRIRPWATRGRGKSIASPNRSVPSRQRGA